ncbi:putative 4-hydroxythreonine-4-phosphate dehydrogenase [Aspergillus mulundensis]|uniref:Putative 4-hydroxythreonine-4-phosphate dehydrogenase n=1 Tax=Aspergillus mulundensis TaxID=1810919 RepID=A0A3D8QRD1_9EURO|nr:putative 4-hydroxythreonine-4-phosphate dehydrogenase [Aspergillus mulundensis]RDW64352.1 putative 4-hydroxythreonine-4-phosphate dehydrogenase [Aspergillus mulundensis]
MVVAIDLPQTSPPRRPRIAVTLGDPSGIGPEIIAKLLSNPANHQRADIILLADKTELQAAITDAGGVHVTISSGSPGPHGTQILDDDSAGQYPTSRCEVSQASGARSIHQLKRALKLVQVGDIDAIVFAPLNKSSLKLAGMAEEDELRWFANQLDYNGVTSEINIAGPLWTARVTSHIGIEEVAQRITKESTLKAIQLLHRLRYLALSSLYLRKANTTRWESGLSSPRLAVCALNPHNGENGAFGRQEIEHIRPAVLAARELGIDVSGPFPCDTIFLKREHFDGIVTMYHDQGQIAMKLLSFDGGVTVQGGLPVPVATPAHGTAFDIVGKNLAGMTSMQNAFDVAVKMAERRIMKDAGVAFEMSSANEKNSVRAETAAVEVLTGSCC